MASRSTATFCSLLGGLGALLTPAGASADEAFLCGPSTIVYVAAGELEQKKKTDPCIAAYFGMTVDPGAKAEAGPAPVKANERIAKANVPDATVRQLKRLDGPEVSDPTADRSIRSASLLPPEASPGTDYRNVRVINAPSDEARWFRHDR